MGVFFSAVVMICCLAFLWGFFAAIGRRLGEEIYPSVRKWLI
ncbi:exported hypothetical protein [Mesorhizobium plurifarium]|uniref:Uncharacterized protein n=1 Tax=Mesorhizobium plurifarium TaxID=69974 RepID=A0A090EFV2_MESPL|nr:exported hypothetical protein [Mesorhizobium plurifarium]